ncbi:hypothetical protein SLEP1_g21359 [Rubroshorea leprosula]|uniref:Uncharacterized protein n=1 Tax=Rubroshorea leprosula TaxID=152421 RepID=A0AAV5JG80_9ROSI|nr:hypothetical protein SLEP1_g21359 [Rubroshorea leprosula]
MNRKRRSSPLCQVLVRWNPPIVIFISIVGVVSIIVAVSVFVIPVLSFQNQFSTFTSTNDTTTWPLKSPALVCFLDECSVGNHCSNRSGLRLHGLLCFFKLLWLIFGPDFAIVLCLDGTGTRIFGSL